MKNIILVLSLLISFALIAQANPVHYNTIVCIDNLEGNSGP